MQFPFFLGKRSEMSSQQVPLLVSIRPILEPGIQIWLPKVALLVPSRALWETRLPDDQAVWIRTTSVDASGAQVIVSMNGIPGFLATMRASLFMLAQNPCGAKW